MFELKMSHKNRNLWDVNKISNNFFKFMCVNPFFFKRRHSGDHTPYLCLTKASSIIIAGQIILFTWYFVNFKNKEIPKISFPITFYITLDLSEIFSIFMIFVINYGFFYVHRKDVEHVFCSSIKLDQLLLQELNIKMNYCKIYKFVRNLHCILLFEVFILCICNINNERLAFHSIMIEFIIPSVANVGMCCYLSGILRGAKSRYGIIKNSLISLNNRDLNVDLLKKKLGKIVCIYSRINSYCKNIGELYNLFVLMNFGGTFVSVVVSLYYLYELTNKPDLDPFTCIKYIIWNTYNILTMFYLVHIYNGVGEKVHMLLIINTLKSHINYFPA